MTSSKFIFTLGLLLSTASSALASSSSAVGDLEKERSEARRQRAFRQTYEFEKDHLVRAEQKGNPVNIGLATVHFIAALEALDKEGAKLDETDLQAFLKGHAANQKMAIFLGNRLFKQGKIDEGKEILGALPRGAILIAQAYEGIRDSQNANATYFNAVRSFQETDPIAGVDHPRLHYAHFLGRTHAYNEAMEQYSTLMAENLLYTTYAAMGMFEMNIYHRQWLLAYQDFHRFLSVLETITADNMTGLCRLFEASPPHEGWEKSLYDLLQKDKVPFKAVEIFEAKVGPLKHTLVFTGFAEGIITRKAEPLSDRIQCTTPRFYPISENSKQLLNGKNIYK